MASMKNVFFNSTLEFPHEEAKSVYAVAVPVMLFFCTLAIILNIFVLITARVLRQPVNVTLKLTYSLSAADIWTSLVIAAGLITHSYLPKITHLPKTSWMDCASYALEALRLGGILTSVLHLLALSCNHYAAIAHPMAYKSWSHRNGYWINTSILVMWICPPIIHFSVFAAYSNRTFAPSTSKCSPDFLGTMGFRMLVFFTIFIPLSLMTLVYLKIYSLLKKLHIQMASVNRQEFISVDPRSSICQHRRSSFLHRKMGVLTTALLIVASSLLGWLPAVIFFVITCSICLFPYTELHSSPRLLFSLTITFNALMILKGLLNPFVYAVRVPEIKEAIISTLLTRQATPRRRMSSIRDQDHHGVHAL